MYIVLQKELKIEDIEGAMYIFLIILMMGVQYGNFVSVHSKAPPQVGLMYILFCYRFLSLPVKSAQSWNLLGDVNCNITYLLRTRITYNTERMYTFRTCYKYAKYLNPLYFTTARSTVLLTYDRALTNNMSVVKTQINHYGKVL